MTKERILITGAGGQIGMVLVHALRKKEYVELVLPTDIRGGIFSEGPFEILDATNATRLQEIVESYQITTIYHLAALLSATGEKNPLKTWEINLGSWLYVLELARQVDHVKKVFFPSSIAVYGQEVDLGLTPQFSPLIPETVYGLTKVAGENWNHYYHNTYGVDVRSLRFPGIIGHESLPGGGTTDYAVDIYHKAAKDEVFHCFLSENATLPMIFMDDAIRATIELMEAPSNQVKIRTSYNISGISFSPKEVFESIKKYKPRFEIVYQPDFRDAIAKSWPREMDDTRARQDWGWKPNYNLDQMTTTMLEALAGKE